MGKKTKRFYIFAKVQVSAFIGGVSDYMIMIALTEMMGFHYTISILFSGLTGAVVNFSINRYWAFASKAVIRTPFQSQLRKFIVVVAGSIFLKSSGTYLISSILTMDYRVSRLIAELFVSYGFNYVLLRRWVFKPKLT